MKSIIAALFLSSSAFAQIQDIQVFEGYQVEVTSNAYAGTYDISSRFNPTPEEKILCEGKFDLEHINTYENEQREAALHNLNVEVNLKECSVRVIKPKSEVEVLTEEVKKLSEIVESLKQEINQLNIKKLQ